MVVALVLSGCSVGPDYERPEIDPPAAWDGASATTGWPGLDWWRGFRADELDRLMDEARRSNFDLAAAVARVKQANAQAMIAGAPLLPDLEAGATAQRTREAPFYAAGTNFFNPTLTASYELDFWGGLRDQAEAARLAAVATDYDRETAELTVQASVADSYFALLSLNERIRLARDNLEAAEGVLDAYKARLEAGTASDLDLAQQENVVAVQRAALPPLVEQLRQAQDALAVLVGRPPESLAAPKGELKSVVLPEVGPGMPSGLLKRRPDVRSAEARLRAANQTVKASVAALFPAITLTAQGGGASASLSELFKPAGLFYNLTGGLAQPIFKGGALEAGERLAQGQYEEQAATYRKAVISAFADVEDALAAVEQENRREREDEVAVGTARRAFGIAQAQLHSGTVDILTVLNTQRSLFSAQDELSQARLAHAEAVVGLFRALGGGWESPQKG